ncbi:MAG TPA: alpha/beta fold hydrolase [Bacteroidia bacterium]|jgi:pimeloyl-ACP methyl ester carboxylesterase|nr:alpha/beta fold hydrolase [Bacteroidia bacterium]
MKRLKKILVWLLSIIAVVYIVVCCVMYLMQEKILFHPTKLEAGYTFEFKNRFEELFIPVSDNKKINGLFFKADSSKGLIFYLHGNAGALDTWGKAAEKYVACHYDMFIPDYRGFGKSEGEIYSEPQFYDDVQAAYNELKKRYNENKIVIIGYSIGTGPAAMLASQNNPKMLVLQAPYYSMVDMMHHSYPFIPDFLLKYKLKTFEFVQKTKAPIYVFHGDSDKVIYYGSSLKLKEHFKKSDTLFTLPGAGHRGMNNNETFIAEMSKILKR